MLQIFNCPFILIVWFNNVPPLLRNSCTTDYEEQDFVFFRTSASLALRLIGYQYITEYFLYKYPYISVIFIFICL